MHPSAMEFGERFFKAYCTEGAPLRILDIGAQDVNGSLKEVSPAGTEYIGVDFVEGKGVDVILQDPYALPFDDNSADVIVCSSVFEHSEFFWLLFLEVLRVLKPNGLLYLNVPSNGYIHRYPVDSWRFYPDSGRALVSWAERNGYVPAVLESFIGEKKYHSIEGDAWNDFVAVFVKRAEFSNLYPKRILHTLDKYANAYCDDPAVAANFSLMPDDFRLIQEQQQTIVGLRQEIDGMHNGMAALEQRNAELAQESTARAQAISLLEQHGESRERTIATLEQHAELRERTIAALEQHGELRERTITALEQQGAQREQLIAGLERERVLGEQLLRAQEERLGALVSERDVLARELAAHVNLIRERQHATDTSNGERDAQIGGLLRAITERDDTIRQLYASTSWRVTRPMRQVKTLLSAPATPSNNGAPVLTYRHYVRRAGYLLTLVPAETRRRGGVLSTAGRALKLLRRDGRAGIRLAVSRVMNPAAYAVAPPPSPPLAQFYDRRPGAALVRADDSLSLDAAALLRADGAAQASQPLISVLMPCYNPDPAWLDLAISSVRQQLYPHWELCIADDASTNPAVRPVLERHAREDARVRLVLRSENGNISAASNSALEIVRGDYVALLDHDDELSADALYWMVKELAAHPQADMIYSDEDKLSPDGSRTERFFKPDWSPELMFNCMYIGHLTMYRTALVRELGGFRSEFDFSQDYDLALRASEKAVCIRHIARVLYHWRQAEGSGSAGGKPYARMSNLAALQSALDRRGLPARAVELPTANRVQLTGWTPSVSIVIPTDSEKNLVASIDAIVTNTDYPAWDIVVVTNSKLADLIGPRYPTLPLVFCRYDKPYNFSGKCNEGAAVATGEIVVFFNDDVRPTGSTWLADLIEYLAVPGVGAVAPKLLYEDGRIQHAGLVAGVRGLVGTAFHCLPEQTNDYFNFAQSVRDVAALSGACFAMRRQVFFDVGAFDAVNTPIMHSDFDLSFKVREHGLRCVYTPHSTLLHIGHQSLAEFDKKKPKFTQDKADIYLLKRWGGYLSEDPYFTDNMRGLLYRDSPEPIVMWGQNRPDLVGNGPDVLVVTHDLSGSGAPMVAYLAARQLLRTGAFPVIAAPEDGPMREQFIALGIPVIIDSLLLTRHESVLKLARNFDLVLANTVACWPIVYQMLDEAVPVMWYLHESHLLTDMARDNPLVATTLRKARNIYAGSERAATFCQPFNSGVTTMLYGVPDIDTLPKAPPLATDTLVFSVFGTIEPRKGQDVFVEAVRLLAARGIGKAQFRVVGRTLDADWVAALKQQAADLPDLVFYGGVNHDEYLTLMRASHVVVCPSRDDTLPLVTLDALCLGKALILTSTTGTSAFMTSGMDGYIVPKEDAQALADSMQALIDDPASLGLVGPQARATFLRNFSEQQFAQRFVQHVDALARRAA
jgi:GT2 family glycosyltransferase/SAM-dependent methyltransferase